VRVNQSHTKDGYCSRLAGAGAAGGDVGAAEDMATGYATDSTAVTTQIVGHVPTSHPRWNFKPDDWLYDCQ
jgi:hypothetical protein